MDDSKQYKKALELAIQAHSGQKRWNGDDYITHTIRVAHSLLVDENRVIAILHDVIEDTNVTMGKLINELELNPTQINALDCLTRREAERYVDYIIRVSLSARVTMIKLLDLQDNLFDIRNGQQKDKYQLARAYLLKAVAMEE